GFTLDTAAPSAPTLSLASDTGSSGSDGVTSNGQVNVGGLEAGSVREYSTNAGATWTAFSGSSITLSGDGSKSVLVRQTDAAGNVSASSVALGFTLDTAAPTISAGPSFSATQVSITANDGTSSIDLYVGSNSLGTLTKGSSTALTLPTSTSYNGELTVKDAAGNSTSTGYDLILGTDAAGNNLTAAGNVLPTAIYGFGGNDTITGSGFSDTIVGGAGNDSLTGSAGNDTFNVDAGSDTITDLGGSDVLVVSVGATATATVTAAFTATAATQNSGTATLNSTGFGVDLALVSAGTAGYTVTGSGATAMTLKGSAFADSITGGAGADTISGGAGNDTISGGAGADSIDLGLGNDVISFGVLDAGTTFNTTSTRDTVTGFAHTAGAGGDSIRIVESEPSGAGNANGFNDAGAVSNDATGTQIQVAATGGANLSSFDIVVITNAVTSGALTSLSAVATAIGGVTNGTGTASDPKNDAIFLVNDGTSTGIYEYVYDGVSGNKGSVEVTELLLIGTVNAVIGTGTTAADIVFA
ncbi:MAG: hypothetical protein RJA36_3844, partial [Pseudomonadota bacterium]